MDPTDAAELIAELHEEKAEQAEADRFRNRAALLIAILAAILAVGGLGGGNATDDLVGNNIRASDTWAFYQAKNIRQTMYELAIDDLEATLAAAPEQSRAALAKRIADYRAKVDRYESEPDAAAPNDALKGEGKAQLRAQAQAFEQARERAAMQDDNFDLAEVSLQLALVLGSVAILSLNRAILALCIGFGAIGALLTLNGFLLLASLPI